MSDRRSLRSLSVVWIGLSIACTSCAWRATHAVRVSRCNEGAVCVVEGQLVAAHGAYGVDADLTTSNGRIEDKSGCIAVALPPDVTDDWNPRRVRASGQVYALPDGLGLFSVKIRDRWFDVEACYSGLAMYVDQIEQVR